MVLAVSLPILKEQVDYVSHKSEAPQDIKTKAQMLYEIIHFLEKSYKNARYLRDIHDKEQQYTSVIQQLNSSHF